MLARSVYQRWGITDIWDRLSPTQVLFYLFAPQDENTVDTDKVDEVIGHNLRRGERGLRPVVPSWMIEGEPNASNNAVKG